MKIALITGASSGIGLEFACKIDEYFYSFDEIWLVARDRQKLEEAKKLINNHVVRIFPVDITDRASFLQVKKALNHHGATICLFVNSAGSGINEEFFATDIKDSLDMVDVNIKGPMQCIYEILPYMHRYGRIILMSSGAALIPQPGFNVYAASKSFVLNFGTALNEELKNTGLSVTTVVCGPVNTPFLDKAYKNKEMPYFKKIFVRDPERIVMKALKDAAKRKPVSVFGSDQKALYALTGRPVTDRIIKFLNRG
ncbi:MAG: SDR family NAD(P)-dependent oxidoreductase [Lachnospiraceae bacterium]|nr:SDR family NAD(P)-dependent oxidoreductase [Lachnospiraceae bacterium]